MAMRIEEMKPFFNKQVLGIGIIAFGVLSGGAWPYICVKAELNQRAIASDPQALKAAKRVHEIFTQSCFRCHGQPGEKVRGGFDYVLDFNKMRSNPDFINLNDPLKSRLYQMIEDGEMPFGPSAKKLDKNEKDAVLDWLKAGAPALEESKNVAAVKGNSTAAYSYVLNAMVQDLKSIREEKREDIRYLSLAHMPEAGDLPQDLEIFRDALAKLVNSLSFQKDIFQLQAIDNNRLIYRIDLNALGWNRALWESMAQANPYALTESDEVTFAINEQTKSGFPFVRGDWFTFATTSSKPQGLNSVPFYYQFLGIPNTDTALEKDIIGLDVDKNIIERRVLRAGFSDSGVSQNNRMIERHRSRYGAYWKSYDFKEGTGTSDLFTRPTGPGDKPNQFQHAGGEIIFNLPNGLQGYMLVDSKHKRLDEAPTQIVQDTSRRNATIVNGISCISCHSVGMRQKSDQIREYVEKNSSLFQQSDLEEIFATYQGNTKLNQAFAEDQSRFIKAMKEAGVKNIKGDIEPVRFLTDRFEKDVDLKRAAAELGVSLETLEQKASKDPELSALVSRMAIRGMPRFVFVDVYQQMLALVTTQGTEGSQTNLFKMSFMPIAPGTFLMGSPDGTNGTKEEPDRGRDERQHQVAITRAFEMQTTTVTQLQWFKVMEASNSTNTSPSQIKNEAKCIGNFDKNRQICPNFPVEQVSYNQVKDFIDKLNLLTRDGYKYRLPTEAEWEYSARAGSKTAYYFGDDVFQIGKFAWFVGNSGNQTHDVQDRTHPPNRFGLYDMHGNVGQWVDDIYDSNYGLSSKQLLLQTNDPSGGASGSERVIRGGSLVHVAQVLRSASRFSSRPVNRSYFVGFRLVRTR